MNSKLKPERALWIDRAKAYGIMLVVIGHVSPITALHHPIYVFHMPLFFLLSGMTFKPFEGRADVIKRSRSLLLPYLAFGILITLILAVANRVMMQGVPIPGPLHFLLGGTFLTGAYGIFWFPPCLLATLLLLDRILHLTRWQQVAAVILIALAAAWLSTMVIYNPWGLLTVGMALPFAYAGYTFGTSASFGGGKALIWLAGLLLLFAILQSHTGPVDYKYLRFGDLPQSVLLAFAGSAIICILSLVPVPWLDRVGTASLTIMYVHLPIYYLLQPWLAWPSIMLLAVGGGTLLHLALARWSPARKWLLGRPA